MTVLCQREADALAELSLEDGGYRKRQIEP